MSEQEPTFRVIRGAPTAEELAALVGTLLLRTRPAPAAPPPAVSAWVRQARPGTVSPSGMPARPTVDAWRLSGLPR